MLGVFTVVAGHEGDVVEAVLDEGGLPVQHHPRGDPSIQWVDVQPVGWVEQLGVPVFQSHLAFT